MKATQKIILTFGFLALGACSSNGTSTSSLIGAYSEPETLVVNGTTEPSCTITGSQGRTLGTGAPSGIEYTYGLEEMGVVTCGSLKSLFTIGDSSVTLSDASTTVAEQLENSNLEEGTALVASAIESVDQTLADENVISSPTDKAVIKADHGDDSDDSSGSGNAVTDSLDAFIAARDDLKTQTSATAIRDDIITLLVNSGEGVVIENVGSNQTITSCANTAVQKYSQYAVATDASAVGMTGCLVYHSLDAVTDLNNPAGAPAANDPTAFRSVTKESGVVQELTDSITDGRLFSISDIQNFFIYHTGPYGLFRGR